jgi:hypothetical protein
MVKQLVCSLGRIKVMPKMLWMTLCTLLNVIDLLWYSDLLELLTYFRMTPKHFVLPVLSGS